MAIHFTESEAAALGLGALVESGALVPAPTPLFAAVMADDDAAPPEVATPRLETPAAPPIVPHVSTQAYALIRAAIALSVARYGAPAVARVPGGWGIRIGEALAVGVDITQPLVTVVSQHVREGDKWRILEVQRLPKLTPHELVSLFVTGKE